MPPLQVDTTMEKEKRPLQALVVEDNQNLREAIIDILTSHFPDMAVDGAKDGETAFHQIDDSAPDLVIMDIQLPGENGLKLTQRLKTAYPGITVVIHSNYDQLEYREAAEAVGGDYFISKRDSTMDEITALVQSIISSR